MPYRYFYLNNKGNDSFYFLLYEMMYIHIYLPHQYFLLINILPFDNGKVCLEMFCGAMSSFTNIILNVAWTLLVCQNILKCKTSILVFANKLIVRVCALIHYMSEVLKIFFVCISFFFKNICISILNFYELYKILDCNFTAFFYLMDFSFLYFH